MTRFVFLGLFLLSGIALACATPSASHRERSDPERRLRILERDFLAFTQRPLDVFVGASATELDAGLSGLDPWVSELESLRLRYLQIAGEGSTEPHRLIALLRIAEMHLDLGARIRRIPYPDAWPPSDFRKFDDTLSREALPLEIVGISVLEQVVDYAARIPPSVGEAANYVARCELYLMLHREADGRLDTEHLATLTRELLRKNEYPAPKTLLEAGRIGNRASR